MLETPGLVLKVHQALREVSQAAWDGLLRSEDSPFLKYDWLESMERTGCVRPERGWWPQHLTFWRGEMLVAAAPVYIKGSLEGEFVFDHHWQDAAQRMGIPYYPKLIVAVPFTPATGARLLIAEGEDRPVLVQHLSAALQRLAEGLGCSGVHILFPSASELPHLTAAGWALRPGIQYQWHNQGYGSYADFLGCFTSKRRHQLKRERREVREAGITMRTYRGKEITEEVLHAMDHFCDRTVQQFYPWTRRYLTRAFFERVIARMPEHIEIVLAREGGIPIAGAFNVCGGGVLYGRYWGTAVQRRFLHFSVCYYHAIEECIERGLRKFEPGAGGQHKLPRGFEPTLTWSAHQLQDPRLDGIIRAHLVGESEAVQAVVAHHRQRKDHRSGGQNPVRPT